MKIDTAIDRQRRGMIGRLVKVRGDRSQNRFAKDLGTRQQNINRYEQGVAPHVDFLIRLSEVEEVDLHWLITGSAL